MTSTDAARRNPRRGNRKRRDTAAVNGRALRLPDGRVVQAGTVADAAAICGVKPNTYTQYKRPDRRGPPAPGPITVPDPVTGQPVPYLFPGTRAAAYDLNAVADWDAQRPGSGYHQAARTADLRWTPMRQAVLADAEAGRLMFDARGLLDIGALTASAEAGKRPELAVLELRRAGAFDVPPLWRPQGPRRLKLSGGGATLLERYRTER